MIIRIVKMTFQEQHISSFRAIFNSNKKAIADSKSCSYVSLLQDQNNKLIFFTYSHWESPADLEAYRNSDFFKSVWSQTKQFFAEKPAAWSLLKEEEENSL